MLSIYLHTLLRLFFQKLIESTFLFLSLTVCFPFQYYSSVYFSESFLEFFVVEAQKNQAKYLNENGALVK